MLITGKMSIFPIFLLLLFYQALSTSSFSAKLVKRVRRSNQTCADGTYLHEGSTCCQCASGQRLKQHCDATQQTVCELCDFNTYNSNPNHQESCVPCTSCNQPNANLEEEEPCTPHRDAKCRCKKDHYCNSNTQVCKICQPCDRCDSSGIQEPCTSSKNTVCKNHTNRGWIAAVVFGVLIVAVAVGFICWKKRHRRPSPPLEIGLPLTVRDADIRHLVPDIAAILGWNEMKKIATRSGMSAATIESVQLNTPHNSEEWTIQLLSQWVENTGTTAPSELIRNLQRSRKKVMKGKILEILRRENPDTMNTSA